MAFVPGQFLIALNKWSPYRTVRDLYNYLLHRIEAELNYFTCPALRLSRSSTTSSIRNLIHVMSEYHPVGTHLIAWLRVCEGINIDGSVHTYTGREWHNISWSYIIVLIANPNWLTCARKKQFFFSQCTFLAEVRAMRINYTYTHAFRRSPYN